MRLSASETIKNATKQYHLDNDNVLSYLNDCVVTNNTPIRIVYEAYVRYAYSCNHNAVTINKFSRRLKSLGYDIKVENVNGTSMRVIKAPNNL